MSELLGSKLEEEIREIARGVFQETQAGARRLRQPRRLTKGRKSRSRNMPYLLISRISRKKRRQFISAFPSAVLQSGRLDLLTATLFQRARRAQSHALSVSA